MNINGYLQLFCDYTIPYLVQQQIPVKINDSLVEFK